MDEQDLNPQTEADDTPDAPAEEPEKRLTQAEVGRLIAAERKKAREAALRELEQTKQRPAKENGSKVPTAELQNQIDSMRLELTFERAVRRFGLGDSQVEALRDLAVAARPKDLDDWLSGTVDRLGLNQKRESTQTQPKADKAAAPTSPPVSDRGGPGPVSNGLASDSPMAWTESDVQRIIDGEESFEKGVQKVKRMFMSGLRNVSVEFPRGPK